MLPVCFVVACLYVMISYPHIWLSMQKEIQHTLFDEWNIYCILVMDPYDLIIEVTEVSILP